jgi:hypothetical protein
MARTGSAVCSPPHIGAKFYCANAKPDLLLLATYMASSARRISLAAFEPSFGNTEIPMLPPTLSLTSPSRPLTSQGAWIAAKILAAIIAMCLCSCRGVIRHKNSSPP